MRKAIILTACLLSLLGCSKEQISSRPCTFDVEITEIKSNKIRFTINPSNPDAYYSFRIEPDYSELYNYTGKVLLESEMMVLLDLYDIFDMDSQQNMDFADTFCYQGRTQQVEMFLDPGRDHKLVVFQVNPWKREGLSYPKEVLFRTRDFIPSDLKFSLEFRGDTLRIHPSDLQADYFWDYESVEIVNDEYVSPIPYFYSLIDMYEQYGFMESQLSRGDDEWVFPRDDQGISPGTQRYLILAGYKDGQLNTEETIVKFTWSPGSSGIDEWILPNEGYEEEE